MKCKNYFHGILMCLCLVLLGTSAKAAIGDLDTSFGGDGIVLFDSGFDDDFPTSVVIDADGNLLLAGYMFNGIDSDWVVLRYLPTGELDTTFGGGDGIVLTDLGGDTDDGPVALKIDADGKLVVGGYINTSAYAVVRYTALGVLDTTFGGGDGVVTTPALDPDDTITAMAIDTVGHILLGGSFFDAGSSSSDFAFVRYTSAGILDTSFGGGDGIVTQDLGAFTNDAAGAMLIDANGKILMAGTSAGMYALARFNVIGILDTTFGGGDGFVTTEIGGSSSRVYSLVSDADENLVLAGAYADGSDFDIALTRYTSAGILDTSFGGGDGIVTSDSGIDDDICVSLAIASNGDILCAGYYYNGTDDDFLLLRYTSAGELATTFTDSGYDLASGTSDLAMSFAIDAEGNFVIVGQSSSGMNSDIAIIRILGTVTTATVDDDSTEADDGSTEVDDGSIEEDDSTTDSTDTTDATDTGSTSGVSSAASSSGCSLNTHTGPSQDGYVLGVLLLVAIASVLKALLSKKIQS
jgi:uncharacterized delta-60 repeat protein